MHEALEVDAQVEAGMRVTPAEPPKPVYPDKITKEDRQDVELLFLKLQNAQLQVQALDAQKTSLVESMRELQEEMKKLHVALSAKYGIDMRTAKVAPDGTITRPS